MCVLQPPQNEGSVSFSVSWNICKHLSRLMICSSTSVSTSSVERCLVISFEVGSYSSSIIWECHSIAMWHFLSQSYIGMVSLGSMTHPLHFSVQLHKEQLYPCLSTILRTNGLSSLWLLRSSDLSKVCFQSLWFHHWFSLSRYFEFFFRIRWAIDHTSSYTLLPVGCRGNWRMMGEESS